MVPDSSIILGSGSRGLHMSDSADRAFAVPDCFLETCVASFAADEGAGTVGNRHC